MRTVVGVAEARAQLSDIISQAVHHGTVTVIERYGRPAVAVVPVEALDQLPDTSDGEVQTTEPEVMTARERQARLLDALARLQEVVAEQTPEEADAVYAAFNEPYQASRGRRLER